MAPGSSSWMGDKERRQTTQKTRKTRAPRGAWRKNAKKIIKIHFIQDKTAFYLVVSNIITTFASDKENN
jgi:hypothetical protein